MRLSWSLPAVALLDRNGVYGAQRFSVACREHGVRPIIGSDLTMEDGTLLPGAGGKSDRLQKSLRTADPGASAEREGKLPLRWEELPEFSEGLMRSSGERMPARRCARAARARSRRLAATAALLTRAASKEVCGEAPRTAREARALPGISQIARNCWSTHLGATASMSNCSAISLGAKNASIAS